MNEKTDAFAFGLVAIEILTGLYPRHARELVDDYEQDDLVEMVEEQHHHSIANLQAADATSPQSRRGSGGGSLASKLGDSLKDRKERAKQKRRQMRARGDAEESNDGSEWPRRPCGVWPANILRKASSTAASCCKSQSRRRLSVTEALPDLEALLSEWDI
jgi:hypothetical protein